MFPDSGQRPGESRQEYLERLKRKIHEDSYLSQALDELADGLTRGLEKRFMRVHGSQKDHPQKKI